MAFLWNKIPTQKEWEIWRENNRDHFNEWHQKMMRNEAKSAFYSIQIVHKRIDDEVVIRYQRVPPKFDHMWKIKTKVFSISFVLIGLWLQLVKIFILPNL